METIWFMYWDSRKIITGESTPTIHFFYFDEITVMTKHSLSILFIFFVTKTVLTQQTDFYYATGNSIRKFNSNGIDVSVGTKGYSNSNVAFNPHLGFIYYRENGFITRNYSSYRN